MSPISKFNLIEIQAKEETKKIVNIATISFVAPEPNSRGSILTYLSNSEKYSIEEHVSEPYENFKTIPGFFEVNLHKGGTRIISSANIARIDPAQPKISKGISIHMLSPDVRSTEELEVNETYEELKQLLGL